MFRTTEQWIEEYKQKKALWIHDGNPNRPHALLTSGKHSEGFFNSRLVISDEKLLREAASDLVELFVAEGGRLSKVEVVVGPQTGATKLAEFISDQISALTRNDCYWASPTKSESDGKKSMIFNEEDKELLRGQLILLCEDVITTGGSIELTADAVTDAHGIVMPYVLTLVNRSGLTEVSGRKIISLIDRHMPILEPEKCPLCWGLGSEPIRPKEPREWELLNAIY